MKMNKKTVSTAIAIALGSTSISASAGLTSSATLSFGFGSSYFKMDTNGNGDFSDESPTNLTSFNGIHIGSAQAATGSHSGPITGSEGRNIDNPWEFFGSTGMHQTTSPITATSVTANGATLDMSGWGVTWNGIPNIPMVQQGAATMSCTVGSSCSDTSSYTLDALFHVNGAGFTTVGYALHLEGFVSQVPVPAAAWLFGSGLLGLIGVARKKQSA